MVSLGAFPRRAQQALMPPPLLPSTLRSQIGKLNKTAMALKAQLHGAPQRHVMKCRAPSSALQRPARGRLVVTNIFTGKAGRLPSSGEAALAVRAASGGASLPPVRACDRCSARRAAAPRACPPPSARPPPPAPAAGIVQGMGRVKRVQRKADFCTFDIEFPAGRLEAVQTGGSIAINGTCLTVVGASGNTAQFDVIGESLARTNLGLLQVGAAAGDFFCSEQLACLGYKL